MSSDGDNKSKPSVDQVQARPQSRMNDRITGTNRNHFLHPQISNANHLPDNNQVGGAAAAAPPPPQHHPKYQKESLEILQNSNGREPSKQSHEQLLQSMRSENNHQKYKHNNNQQRRDDQLQSLGNRSTASASIAGWEGNASIAAARTTNNKEVTSNNMTTDVVTNTGGTVAAEMAHLYGTAPPAAEPAADGTKKRPSDEISAPDEKATTMKGTPPDPSDSGSAQSVVLPEEKKQASSTKVMAGKNKLAAEEEPFERPSEVEATPLTYQVKAQESNTVTAAAKRPAEEGTIGSKEASARQTTTFRAAQPMNQQQAKASSESIASAAADAKQVTMEDNPKSATMPEHQAAQPIVEKPMALLTRTPCSPDLKEDQISSEEKACATIAAERKVEQRLASDLVRQMIQQALDRKKVLIEQEHSDKRQASASLKPSQHYVPVAAATHTDGLSKMLHANPDGNGHHKATGTATSTLAVETAFQSRATAGTKIPPHAEIQLGKRKVTTDAQHVRVSSEVEFIGVVRPAQRQNHMVHVGLQVPAVSRVASSKPSAAEPLPARAVVPPQLGGAGVPAARQLLSYNQTNHTISGRDYVNAKYGPPSLGQRPQQQQQQQQPPQAAPAPIQYDIDTMFAPLGRPELHNLNLQQAFYQLSSSNACTFQSIRLFALRPRSRTNVQRQTNVSIAVSRSYQAFLDMLWHHKAELPQNSPPLILSCSGCFMAGAATHGYCLSGSVYFPTDVGSLNACFLALKGHLMVCPNSSPQLKNSICGVTTIPQFVGHISERIYLSQFCAAYRPFEPQVERQTQPILRIESDEIYNDNMDAMEDALKTTSMSLSGVIGEEICDIIDSDIVSDDPFCLFVFESLELVRVYKNSCLPSQRRLFQDASVDARDTEVFLLQCRCCHGRRENGSFNPDAGILVLDSKNCAVNITKLIYEHFDTCFTGHHVQKLNLLKIHPRCEDVNFRNFAAALHFRIVSIIEWIREVYEASASVSPVPDQELWKSAPLEQLRGWFSTNGGIPVSNLTGPRKAAGAPGSAVLDCWGFPKVGLLHGNVETPTTSDLKISRPKKRPRVKTRRLESKLPGARVRDVENLPSMELAKAQKYLQNKGVHIDNL